MVTQRLNTAIIKFFSLIPITGTNFILIIFAKRRHVFASRINLGVTYRFINCRFWYRVLLQSTPRDQNRNKMWRGSNIARWPNLLSKESPMTIPMMMMMIILRCGCRCFRVNEYLHYQNNLVLVSCNKNTNPKLVYSFQTERSEQHS